MSAKLLGLFYITAALTSIVAGIIYDIRLLSDKWLDVTPTSSHLIIRFAFFMDLLLILSVIGTAVILYPYLRLWNESMALAYFSFRALEAVFLGLGLVAIMALLNLSTEEIPLGHALQTIHLTAYMIATNLMLGVNTFLYSYLLYHSQLVPRALASFGMVSALMVFLSGALELFGLIVHKSGPKVLLGLPVGLFEMTLAFWLITRGFNPDSLRSVGL